MVSKKRELFVLLFLLSTFFLFSCNLGTVLTPGNSELNGTKSSVEQTVDARLTELAFETMAAQADDASQNGEGTPTASAEEVAATGTRAAILATMQTATIEPTATQQTCDRMSFVRDVTIPDGTKLYPGSVFTKTWRLKNTGTCTWTSDYALVFHSGNALEAVTTIPLGGTVRPGEMINLSVFMKAPSVPGEYTGKWKMRNASGGIFGVGEAADGPIWVSIVVVKYQGEMDEAYPRDFARNIGAARWQSNAGVLSPNAGEDFKIGSVDYLENPTFEGGHQDDEPTLLMIPSEGSDGIIFGRYPSIEIEDGDHFRAIVGCMEDSFGCYARLVLNYKLPSGQTKTLDSWLEEYDGDTTQVDVDLSSLDGEQVELILQVQNLGNSQDDRIFWLAPEIVNVN